MRGANCVMQTMQQNATLANVQHNFRLYIKTMSEVSARRMLLYVNDGESYDVDENYMFRNACFENEHSIICMLLP